MSGRFLPVEVRVRLCYVITVCFHARHHQDSVYGIDFSTNDQGSEISGIFATASKDCTIAIWSKRHVEVAGR